MRSFEEDLKSLSLFFRSSLGTLLGEVLFSYSRIFCCSFLSIYLLASEINSFILASSFRTDYEVLNAISPSFSLPSDLLNSTSAFLKSAVSCESLFSNSSVLLTMAICSLSNIRRAFLMPMSLE